MPARALRRAIEIRNLVYGNGGKNKNAREGIETLGGGSDVPLICAVEKTKMPARALRLDFTAFGVHCTLAPWKKQKCPRGH